MRGREINMKWFESEENNVEPRKNEEVKENSNEVSLAAFKKGKKNLQRKQKSQKYIAKRKNCRVQKFASEI